MTAISLSRKAPILLIDASYYVFYRFFATSRWWSFQKKDGTDTCEEDALLSDEGFKSAFAKHVKADIEKLQKRWGLVGRGKKPIAPNNIVFCKDCPRSTIWRNDVYNEYKKSRAVNTRFDSNAFACFSSQVSLTPEAFANDVAFQSVALPRLEADDVACLLFRQIRKTMGHDQPVVFITGDHDYLQLKDEHCEIYGLPEKNLWEAGVKKGTNDINRKILMGDPSDNIPQVLNKKEINVYMGLEESDRQTYIDKLGKADSYQLNKTLMCWTQIPDQLVEEFNQKWQVYERE